MKLSSHKDYNFDFQPLQLLAWHLDLTHRRTRMPKERVTIFDTTLRDGEQSPGCSMNLTEKVAMARKLEELGVDVIEAGFPIASEGDFAAVQAVAARRS